MVVEDQLAAATLVMDPKVHGIAGPVEAIETHISRIFLAGDRVYKMKRSVKLPYVDFSTPIPGSLPARRKWSSTRKPRPDFMSAYGT